MRPFSILAAVALWLTACSSIPHSASMELHEASTSFDIEHVEPFLHRVAGLVDIGFDEYDIEVIVATLNTMELDDEALFHFDVTHNYSDSELRVILYLDDIDTVELYFFTSYDLSESIMREMEAFADEHGM